VEEAELIKGVPYEYTEKTLIMYLWKMHTFVPEQRMELSALKYGHINVSLFAER
jgi:hypothetical protein